MNEPRSFGSRLYDVVFQGNLQSCLLRGVDQAEQQGDRLTALAAAPYAHRITLGISLRLFARSLLSHSVVTPIVRTPEIPQIIRPLAVSKPLNVLVMISSPSDYEKLNVEAEWQKVVDGISGTQQGAAAIQITRLTEATLAALQKQLRRQHYHIFHFIGHGGFDEQTNEGVLLLEDEEGRSRQVSGNQLGTLLHDHPSLRLALLNSCEGGRTSQSDPFAGVAQQLLRQGVPAVIAMQFEITDSAAITLAQEFYSALAEGYPVDGALAEARKSLFTSGNDIEWGSTGLFLRAQGWQALEIDKTASSSPAHEPEIAPQIPEIADTSQSSGTFKASMFSGKRGCSVVIMLAMTLLFGLYNVRDRFQTGIATPTEGSTIALAKTRTPTPALTPTAQSATPTSVLATNGERNHYANPWQCFN